MPTTDYPTGAALVTEPLGYGLALALVGLTVVLLTLIGEATHRFRVTEGMTVPAAALRATAVVLVGGPLRLARRAARRAAVHLGLVPIDADALAADLAAAMRRHPSTGIRTASVAEPQPGLAKVIPLRPRTGHAA